MHLAHGILHHAHELLHHAHGILHHAHGLLLHAHELLHQAHGLLHLAPLHQRRLQTTNLNPILVCADSLTPEEIAASAEAVVATAAAGGSRWEQGGNPRVPASLVLVQLSLITKHANSKANSLGEELGSHARAIYPHAP
jgi:hypothetical protein